MINYGTTLPLSTQHRVSQISFHPTKGLLAVQSHDKSIDIIRVRTEEELRKKQARRKRREKEKTKKKINTGSKQDSNDIGDVDMGNISEQDGTREKDELALEDFFTPYLVIRASGKIRSFSFNSKPDERTSGNSAITDVGPRLSNSYP